MMILGPVFVSSASRSVPGPELFNEVTCNTSPPRPPTVCDPKPVAPGNAGIAKAEAAEIEISINTRSMILNNLIALSCHNEYK